MGYLVLLGVAELAIVPVGTALVVTLAPAQFSGLLMGSVALSDLCRDVARGMLGALWSRWPPSRYFGLMALLPLVSAMVLWLRLPALNAMLKRSVEEIG